MDKLFMKKSLFYFYYSYRAVPNLIANANEIKASIKATKI